MDIQQLFSGEQLCQIDISVLFTIYMYINSANILLRDRLFLFPLLNGEKTGGGYFNFHFGFVFVLF